MRLSDFQVLSELGWGSHSRVLHARRLSDGAEFALKQVNKSFLVREHKTESAVRERELLEALAGQPGVVRLHFAFQDVHSLFLATEVCAGDLHTQLARREGGRASRAEARFWVAELALALAAVHALGAIHRDVKPENVLLNASGHVRLCDFGSAKRLTPPAPPAAAAGEPEPAPVHGRERRRGGSATAGTAEYCAPEVVEGGGGSYASDFWSLGCVLYQCLAGKPPFRGATEYLTFQAILAGAPAPYPEDQFDASARATCEALLTRAPTERVSTLNRLQHLPLFDGVAWDDLWTAQGDAVPPVLPAPAADAARESAEARWAADEAAAPSPPPPPPPAVEPWVLLDGESEVRSASTTRKRGRNAQPGRLVLTSGSRLGFVGEGGAALLCASVAQARLRAIDERHLAMRSGAGEEVILELEGGGAERWVADAAAWNGTG